MALSSTDTLVRFMSQYTLEIDTNTIYEDLTCIVCRKIMIDPYQTYCRCQYCRECIAGYFNDGHKYCCGDKDVCQEERLVLDTNVFRSTMLNEKILKARIHCPNKSCPYISEINKMEEHLLECDQQSMECPYSYFGCETENKSKDGIFNHLHDNTLTHSHLLIELIHNLKNDFEMSILEIANLKDELKLKDVQMGDLKREVTEQFEEQRRNMNKQERKTKDQQKEIDRLKVESEKREVVIEGLKEEVTTLKKEIRDYIRNINNMVETSERESTKYRNETRSTLTKMKEETDKNKSAAIVTQSMNDVRRSVGELTKTVALLNVGTNTKVSVSQLLFTVDKFITRKTAKEEVLSPYFYSHANGYKLQLRLFPAGIRDGKGTHLTVCFVICKGEYDDLLPWPCKHTFTIGIIDQTDGETFIMETIDYASTDDNLRYTFDKPTNGDNHEVARNIATHDQLEPDDGFMEDTSVIILCTVSAPA